MTEKLSRRQMLAIVPASVAGLFAARAFAETAQVKEPITVYRDPTCGCCHKWIQHAEANGFKVTDVVGDMAPIRSKFNIPRSLQSCHTAIVRGFVIEGHVPAADVKKLLAAKPAPAGIIGLTIPGMPQSAPGMDAVPFQPYQVLTFDKNGKTTVFTKHDKA